ncbi:MAG TPA: hypothetical protein VFN71_04400 [Methylomirabilota bacterium]|nr:hypothetical protein [Methylomirabilota bacterium]
MAVNSATLGTLLLRYQTAFLVLGGLDLAVVGILDMPGNPLLDLNAYPNRTIGAVAANGGGILLALGLLPRIAGWLDAVTRWPARRRGWTLAGGALAAFAALGLVALAWPEYARALTREWGLMEAAQVLLYAVSARIAFVHAGLLRTQGEPHRPFLMVGAACVLLVLEELDYLAPIGVPLAQLLGVHVHLGALHDLLKLAKHVPAVWAGLAALAGLVVAALWRGGFLTARFIRAEALDRTSLPLYAAVIAQALAQALDVDKGVLTPLSPYFRYPLEEPMELASAICLCLGLTLKYVRDRRVAG